MHRRLQKQEWRWLHLRALEWPWLLHLGLLR